jgi:hypothetical protein
MNKAELQPKDGFDWDKVTWGRPDSPPSVLCSYCSAVLPEDDGEWADPPLMMWKADGHAAQFCADCQWKWWGMG